MHRTPRRGGPPAWLALRASPSTPLEDYQPGFRDTVGWSRRVDVEAGAQPHLPIIDRGQALMEALVPGLEAELERMLTGDEVLRAALALHDRKLLAEVATPARTEIAAERKNVRLLELAADRHELWLRVEGSAATARHRALPAMARLQRRLLRRNGAAARRQADLVRIDPALREVVDPVCLRTWLRAFYALAGPLAPAPERLRFAPGEARAQFDATSGRITIGRDVDAGTVFHELGHALEVDAFDVMMAAEAWREARALHADPAAGPVALTALCPGAGYGEDEVALPDHFVCPYVGKLYEIFGSEVVSMGLEHFVSAARMVQLFERDPEHFFFVLGAIEEETP